MTKLSIEELKKIKKDNKSKLKKEFTDFKQQKEKQKLIDVKAKTKKKKIKTFDDYFQECIKNKSFPKGYTKIS